MNLIFFLGRDHPEHTLEDRSVVSRPAYRRPAWSSTCELWRGMPSYFKPQKSTPGRCEPCADAPNIRLVQVNQAGMGSFPTTAAANHRPPHNSRHVDIRRECSPGGYTDGRHLSSGHMWPPAAVPRGRKGVQAVPRGWPEGPIRVVVYPFYGRIAHFCGFLPPQSTHGIHM